MSEYHDGLRSSANINHVPSRKEAGRAASVMYKKELAKRSARSVVDRKIPKKKGSTKADAGFLLLNREKVGHGPQKFALVLLPPTKLFLMDTYFHIKYHMAHHFFDSLGASLGLVIVNM